MGIPESAVYIADSLDGRQHGLPGKIALFEFYQAIFLPQVAECFHTTDLVMILEDDARIDEGLWKGGPYSHLQRLVHHIMHHPRPIAVLGYQNNDITKQFNHIKPDFGLHFWTIKQKACGLVAQLLAEIVPQHFDSALYNHLGNLVCYSRYCLAGFIQHDSDCADPNDPNTPGGLRAAREVKLHRDDYKENVLISYIR
jgi:hypothetical protein